MNFSGRGSFYGKWAMMRHALWLAAMILTSGAQAATYYVDSGGGSDSNNGTNQAAAWKSLGKVNGRTFQAGDAILFRAGGVWTGQLHPLGSGAPGSPVVVDEYGAGALPVINGNGVTGNGAVYLFNQQYWEINHLEVINDGTSDADRRGVYFGANNWGAVNHLYLRNCNVHNIRGLPGTDSSLAAKRTGGIVVECTGDSTTATHFNDILIDGNSVTTCQNQGIVAAISGNGGGTLNSDEPYSTAWLARKATGLVIRNNVISDIAKNAMIIRYCDSSDLIEHNVCFNTATDTTGNTMFTSSCGGVVFQYNEGYANLAGDHDGSLYDADLRSRDIIFQYSYSHDNTHGLFWHYSNSSSDTGEIVRYNISQNDQGDIFAFSGSGGGEYIYNNTVYISSTNPPPSNPPQNIFEDRAGGHVYYVYNNVFVISNPTAVYSFSGSTRTFDYNVFYGLHPSSEPSDPHKLAVNPMLAAPGSGGIGVNTLSGYQLQTGSPCISSGKIIANNGGRDFWGNAVPSGGAPDRGAGEYVPPTAPPGVTNLPATVAVNSVILNALVNPNGAATSCYFQYGLSDVYGNFSPTNLLPAGTAALGVSNEITGLFPGTRYHARLVAGNPAGLTLGLDATFTTMAVTPPQLVSAAVLPGGVFQFAFTNPAGANFSVIAATNVALPLSHWLLITSAPVSVGGGLFQVTDSQASNVSMRFYRLRAP